MPTTSIASGLWVHTDCQDNDRKQSPLLPGEALIRRFTLHILPNGLMRIRQNEFLWGSVRRKWDRVVSFRHDGFGYNQ